MKDIVIGVDGTNSFAYRNGSRFVENFVRSVQSDFSLYLPGPTDLQGATGFECSAIYDQVMAFILSTLRELGYNQRVCTVRPEVRISLVGHSRGGHTVIAVARDLQLPVHFMGLYDAVDMTVTLGDTMVVRNTAYTYHAMRSPTMRSRSSW
ncbi:MAG: hypothetical protein IT223_03210, partial [Crocinitomicaceae bacterium]|nr:hypothetical protein [Crocinitomicaceae bacterium]